MNFGFFFFLQLCPITTVTIFILSKVQPSQHLSLYLVEIHRQGELTVVNYGSSIQPLNSYDCWFSQKKNKIRLKFRAVGHTTPPLSAVVASEQGTNAEATWSRGCVPALHGCFCGFGFF